MEAKQPKEKIPGYDYGSAQLAKSPITMCRMAMILQATLWVQPYITDGDF